LVICSDCTGSCKSKYHTFTTTAAQLYFNKMKNKKMPQCSIKIVERGSPSTQINFKLLLLTSNKYLLHINLCIEELSMWCTNYIWNRNIIKKIKYIFFYIYMYIYIWKLNQTVLELDYRAVNFLFFPRRDLNSHHWYTAPPFT
jgi:hypothetical protein